MKEFVTNSEDVIMLIDDALNDLGQWYSDTKGINVDKNFVKAVYTITVPDEVVSGKYCYTPEEGFFISPAWQLAQDNAPATRAELELLKMQLEGVSALREHLETQAAELAELKTVQNTRIADLEATQNVILGVN